MPGWPFRHPPNTRFKPNNESWQARGLVAWWPPLGSRGETLLRNYLPQFNDGSFQNQMEYIFDGEMGYALNFLGSNDFVNVSIYDAIDFGNEDFTVAMWVKLEDVSADNEFLYKGTGGTGTDTRYRMHYNFSSDRLRWSMTDSATVSAVECDALGSPATGVWYHLAGRLNAATSEIAIIVNGRLKSTDTAPAGSAAGGDLRLGGTGFSSKDFTGRMGDLRIYNRALSDAEIWWLYDPRTRWELYAPVVPAVWVVGASFGSALLEVVSEAIDVDEATGQPRVMRRIFGEALEVTEALLRPRTMFRLLAETEGIGEADLRFMALTRSAAESVGLTEATGRARTLARIIAEALGVTEATLRARALARAIGEAVDIGEASNWLANLVRLASETAGVTETVSRVRTLARLVSETVGLTETTQRLFEFVRLVGEVTGITETVVKAATFVRIVGETVDTTEAIDRLKAMVRTVSEATGITETVANLIAQPSKFVRAKFRGMWRSVFRQMD